MKWNANQLWIGLTIRLLSVLALMLVGFAHKPIDLNAPDSYLLAQYRLPDGSYPVLCIGDHASGQDHQGHGKHSGGTGCEACRIASAFLCPAPAGSTGPVLNLALADTLLPSQPILRRTIYPPSAPPQAPPYA
ncbi:hypothetical protein AAIB41_10250 [Brucella sp. BE17]|uniref:hypothetical protein n=1 Tax=Brucella sp. BE17 TaxID=3142977 RepID=UPI0031BBA9CB